MLWSSSGHIKYRLSWKEEDVLRRGLNFAPAPLRILYIDMIAGIESAAKKLNDNDANDLRGRVCSALMKAKPPAPNMTKTEQATVKNLCRSDIVILTADKGSAIVVIDQTDYKSKMENLLNDPVYRKVQKDRTGATGR